MAAFSGGQATAAGDGGSAQNTVRRQVNVY